MSARGIPALTRRKASSAPSAAHQFLDIAMGFGSSALGGPGRAGSARALPAGAAAPVPCAIAAVSASAFARYAPPPGRHTALGGSPALVCCSLRSDYVTRLRGLADAASPADGAASVAAVLVR